VHYTDTGEYHTLYDKYKRQRLMILTEGLVFMLLQIGGLWQVRRVFGREIELAQQQQNFLHSITHELKSPLSSVKLTLQTILKRNLELPQRDKLLNNAISDTVRLESLVDNILFAAKIEKDTHGFANEELNLSDLTIAAAEKFTTNNKQIILKTTVQDNLYYHIDQMGFISVIINLIENAIKYSEPQTEIHLSLVDVDRHVVLTVSDQGHGIANDDKVRVFDKFYRIGSEETRRTKGTGLGLYIVKRFVEIYQGSIDLADNTPKGSIFTLRFPR
jgi:two-component system, OmpR family, phosphate regulon sensor histidine kinase PhoR